MGFFDSLLKSATRRAVNDVIDKAVDNAFNNAGNNNSSANQQQSNTQQPIQIIRPDISGSETLQPCFYPDDPEVPVEGGVQRVYIFEKADSLYIGDSGAGEIDFIYYCANSEDEAYENDGEGLPCLYVGLDEFGSDSHFIKVNKINALRTPVINHPRIVEKVKCDYTSTFGGKTNSLHYLCYRFYPVPEDRRDESCRELVLQFPTNCDIELRKKAMKAFSLMVSTLNVDFRDYKY